jgi:MtrB/PioB family decaheme-associated outer membrane protein
MKSKVFMMVLIFSLLTSWNAFAQESQERTVSGEVTVTPQYLDIKGEKAKFNEYRDIHTGVTGDFGFQYEKGKYYIDFSGKDVGRKDQSYELLGGKWGSFKYDFKYDQIPHNFTTNAKTFYTGFGGNNLTYQPQAPSAFLPNTNFTTWNSFDYSVQRTNYSGGFKLDLLKPFFFDVSLAKETRKGIYPIGVAGTTPGGIAIELPSPVDYITDNFKVSAGYVKNSLSLAVNYVYSTFQNQNTYLNFRDPATANTASTTDTVTLPPDNDYYKLSFQGGVKLPWNSKINADLGTARTTSHANLLNSYVSDATAATSNIGIQGRTGVLLNNYVFNGKIDTRNANLVFTSSPLYFLDVKGFYKYYQRKNKSDQITTTDSTVATPTFTTDLFGYQTDKYGADLGFRLPGSFYLSGGYQGALTKRYAREDVPENKDYAYNVGLRWSGLDFMVAKLGYEMFHRRADFQPPTVTGPTDVHNVETYIRRYDVAGRDRETYKGSLEFFPMDNLNFGFGYKYKHTNYQDTILGLQDDLRHEYSIDADYLIMKRVRLFGYFDYEYVKLHQLQRTLPAGTSSFNPALPPTATAYNWTLSQVEHNLGYGLGGDVYVLPKKLTLRLQHNYVRSDGYADYSYLTSTALALGRNNENIDINGWDTYRLTNYMVKAIYDVNKSLAFSMAWAYEKYVSDDAQYNGYQYVPNTTGTSGAFLTGAYANPGYRANVYMLSGSYRF